MSGDWNCGEFHGIEKYVCLPLAAVDGTRIHNARGLDFERAILDELERAVQANQEPAARLLVRSSALYNCMGLVFASRRTTISIERVREILLHDRYSKRNFWEPQVGDVVVYTNDDEDEPVHVGFIYEKRIIVDQNDDGITVLSKWGDKGEYLHRLNDFPEGRPTELWTAQVQYGDENAKFA
jgi:hypothetical protein